MAYNDTPLPTDLISDSQSEIRENFQLLEDSQVVDEGSTSDGDYIRYENGWQVCIHKFSFVYRDPDIAEYVWDYPASFENPTTATCHLASGSGIWFDNDARFKISHTVDNESDSASSSTFFIFFTEDIMEDGDEVSDTLGFAIGRWK